MNKIDRTWTLAYTKLLEHTGHFGAIGLYMYWEKTMSYLPVYIRHLVQKFFYEEASEKNMRTHTQTKNANTVLLALGWEFYTHHYINYQVEETWFNIQRMNDLRY